MLNSNSVCFSDETRGFFDEWHVLFDESRNVGNLLLVESSFITLTLIIMPSISGSTEKVVSKIFEYQKFVKLNEQFIKELEMEGGDTTQLRKDIAELEARILELKLQQGFRR